MAVRSVFLMQGDNWLVYEEIMGNMTNFGFSGMPDVVNLVAPDVDEWQNCT